MATDLLKLLAARNSIHREPYLSLRDDAQYAAFEQRFPHTETQDQRLCFQVLVLVLFVIMLVCSMVKARYLDSCVTCSSL